MQGMEVKRILRQELVHTHRVRTLHKNKNDEDNVVNLSAMYSNEAKETLRNNCRKDGGVCSRTVLHI